METTNNLSLIEGTFSAEEAKNVLNKLYKHKINFHHVKNFDHYEKCGDEHPNSYKRIEELKQSREHMLSIIEQAEIQGMDLHLSSTIMIDFVEKKELVREEETVTMD